MATKIQPQPNTVRSLVSDFQSLGVQKGMTIIVHSSLKSLGWVCGGANAVVQALMETVGREGTIVMPTQSAELSDPAYWEEPPVPEEWWETIRNEMPAFDPKTTTTLGMGKIVDCFRSYDDVIRSYHPTTSFAAWGKHAHFITEHHSLEFSLGEESPLQKIYDLNGHVLLIGVGYEHNTSLHLAECHANACYTCQQGSPIIEDDRRVWKEYEEFLYDTDKFNEIGFLFERNGLVSTGQVGMAECRLIPQRQLVDFATAYFEKRKYINQKL
ncbi:aminoglycoside N(3)-acetyltransferase [Bacillus testis]|uniref:aminoglycoside N(3)-acetyltransferase n=1 Tax=Bacillus testis TaxID=1622072 RepID=UPI00067F3DD2|nr:AAC(3) family N-acetyltransferase [Bacillus testis]